MTITRELRVLRHRVQPPFFNPRAPFLAWSLLWLISPGLSPAASFDFALRDQGAAIELQWNSESLTTDAPFLHYDFQLESSPNLASWTNLNEVVNGGLLADDAFMLSTEIPKVAEAQFYRLAYRLNVPGADLSGRDLSGADLRNADLSGVNLTGADLSGADLGGAILTGAQLGGADLAGANVSGVDLTGLDLAGLDLSQLQGKPWLSQVTGDPAAAASLALPHIPYNPDPRDFIANDPGVPGVVSVRNAMLMLKETATLGDVNAFLARENGMIVGCAPADGSLTNATLMVQFPTSTALELYELTERLDTDPIIESTAPDILLGLETIPDDSNGATGGGQIWFWDPAGSPLGGNWGLEYARVPQMWNWNDALTKRNAPGVPTCIIDNYFTLSHNDLSFVLLLGPAAPAPNDHGMHVAGIAGATYGNGLGIDGVNPFASLYGYTFLSTGDDFPILGMPLSSFEPGRQANGYRMIQDIREVTRVLPATRLINLSLGFRWTRTTPPMTNSPTGAVLAKIEFISRRYGLMMAPVALANPNVLITCAAGNDSNLIEARLSSPMANAALDLGVPNILVVESHGQTGAPSGFSNQGGHVAAPGELILSTTANLAYDTLEGTSMATPFVTGLAGYLLAVDPSLTPSELKSLLQSGGSNVDAFWSVMEIDNLPGRDRLALRMLLDVDDGTQDGSRRISVQTNRLAHDRSFELVVGSEHLNEDADGDGGPGDGVIDMSDFRRWRDWLLYARGNHGLDGVGNVVKLDLNRDGWLVPGEATHYPRGDFNGDGVLDETGRSGVPGWYNELQFTDLGVLTSSGLWSDPCYPTADVLPGLINSADFTVSAANFFYKYSDVTEANVSAYDAALMLPAAPLSQCLFTPENPAHILTVPVGQRYYVASEPITIGEGTNILLRSIGEIEVPADKAGADYVVDLYRLEMTAVADVENPNLRKIESEPLEEEVDAHIPEDDPGLEKGTAGARGWANTNATLYAVARATAIEDYPPDDPDAPSTFIGQVRWQRSFTKAAGVEDPTYKVKPMILRLLGWAPGDAELSAFAEIVLEIRAYDRSPAWEPIFTYHAEIAGEGARDGNPPTFRIVFQEGDLPDKTLSLDGDAGAEYRQQKHKGTIDLEGIPDGNSFELRYQLVARAVGTGVDGETLAYVADPLDYRSAFRMEYGSFGELPRVKEFAADNEGRGVVTYLSRTNFYYFLYRGEDEDTAGPPVAMKLGIDGIDTLVDPAPPPGATVDSYTLENQPVTQPLDTDGDGIHDVYELERPAILDPLDLTDAAEDPDDDGYSTLAEFNNGTNPEVPDAPAGSAVHFPGVLVPSYSGGQLVHLNGDGLWDLASAGGNTISVALGNAGGIFTAPIQTTVPGAQFLSKSVFADVNSDSIADAIVPDSLSSNLVLLAGLGDGHFEPLGTYPTMGHSQQVVFGDLNSDAHADLAVLSGNGRGVDLFLGNSDGTLTPFGSVVTNLYGVALATALADLNEDGQDDVFITYLGRQVAVFPSLPGGGYGEPNAYPIGSSADSLLVADLDEDGYLDIVTANRSSGDLSLLQGVDGETFLPELRYPLGDLPIGLWLADLNEDTRADVVVGTASSDYVTVLLNSGDGALADPYAVPIGNDPLAGIIDWNGDGHLDLFSGIYEGALVSLGHGDGTFAGRLQIVTGTTSSKAQPVDLEEDGLVELVVLNSQANAIDVWEHAAVTGTNRLVSSLGVGRYVAEFAHGDFNGDQRVDLAVATKELSIFGTNRLAILLQQGDRTFQQDASLPLEWSPDRVLSGDFDGDGDVDLAVISRGGTLDGGNKLLALLGDGFGGFLPGDPCATCTNLATTLSYAAVVDVDGDGAAELLFDGSRQEGDTFVSFLEVYQLDVTGNLEFQQGLVFNDRLQSHQIVDWNGDSYPDLIGLDEGAPSGTLDLLMYPGGPSGFGDQEILVEDVAFESMSRLADLNNDGLLDVISFNTLFLGSAAGGFEEGLPIWIGSAGAQEVRDFDRDGKPDLMSGLSILLQE